MKLEAHFQGKRIIHMLCDYEGYHAFKETMIDIFLENRHPFPASSFSGIPIYLNECPCTNNKGGKGVT